VPQLRVYFAQDLLRELGFCCQNYAVRKRQRQREKTLANVWRYIPSTTLLQAALFAVKTTSDIRICKETSVNAGSRTRLL